jgi:hypothetical protein
MGFRVEIGAVETTLAVVLSTTDETVYVPFTLGVATPFIIMVAPACGRPLGTLETTVMLLPADVSETVMD